MEVHVAIAKVGKYATSESGDSFEMIERPHGGLSFVLVDGQRSGKSAKAISNVVARKAISLLADGMRDGAAARAAHDYLYTYRSGKVSATLNIVSVDLNTSTIRLACNNPAPVYLLSSAGLPAPAAPRGPGETVGGDSEAVGVRPQTRPVITEYTLSGGLTFVVSTDGLLHAGDRRGTPLDLSVSLLRLHAESPGNAQKWADSLLAEAVALDDGRPGDDISVLVLAVREGKRDDARRMSLSLPL